MSQVERIAFRCPSCNSRIIAKVRAVGLVRECPHCSEAIVVPGPVRRDPVKPAVDSDAIRSLHLLAVRAATLVQGVLSKDRQVAILINGLLLYLPSEHELDGFSNKWRDDIDATWKLIQEVKTVIERYGNHHRNVWVKSLEVMRTIDDSKQHRTIRQKRRRWSIAVRRDIWRKYDKRCIHCGIELSSWQGIAMHLDHLVPLSHGGTDDEINLAPTCPSCNLEKGSSLYPEIGGM